MNRLKKILGGAAAVSLISLAVSFQAFAARIAFSDPSAEAGSEVTVNMKISATGDETINSSNVMLSYDASSLQFIEGTGATGDAGSIRVAGEAQGGNYTELAFSLKFKALKPGTTTIAVSTQEVYDKNGQLVNIAQEGSSAVTITGDAAAAGGALLSDLQISPGSLSPAFSPDTENYTAVVGGDVDTVTVSAPAADEGSSVSVSGNEGLQLGENEIVCTVTSADGQTRTYRIVVTKVEGEAGDGAPMAAQVSLKTYERDITVVSGQEGMDIPEGFVQCSVTIDGQAVQGWIWGDDPNPEYCIFYAINEDGESGFYRYDLTEKTLQRYFHDPAGGGEFEEKYNTTALEYNSLLHDYEIRFWIIIGLIALAAILLIVIIVLIAGRGQRDDFMEKRDDGDDGWDPEPRERRSRMTREERYLRGLEEEEEEAEREDDLAFIRKVQAEEGARGYQQRGGAYQPEGTGPRGAGQMNGVSSRENGRIGADVRGNTGQRNGQQPGQNSRGNARGGTAPRTAGRTDHTSAGRGPAGGTRAVPVSEVRGAAGANTSRGRAENMRGTDRMSQPGRGQAKPATEADDDFEVIDLE
ncbi:MAG: hypothetical protein HFG74_09230 [Hungatella sp.]|nr:hypothetical protein [Hungatella sp.]